MIGLETLKWIATLSMTISAILVSARITWATKYWAYIGFLIGHCIWCYAGFAMKEFALFYLNFFFIFIDFYAIGIRINKLKENNNG